MAPLLTFLLHRPLRIEAARTLAGVAVNRALDARQLLLVLVLLIALPFELTNVLRMQSREGDRAGAHFWQLRTVPDIKLAPGKRGSMKIKILPG